MTNYERTVQSKDAQVGDTHMHATRVNEQVAGDGVDRIQQVIIYLMSILGGLLLIRFVLSMLGANHTNAFAKLIYGLTNVFVQPFQSLFRVNTTYGIAWLELETIVAICFYALVAWAIAGAFGLIRKNNSPVNLD